MSKIAIVGYDNKLAKDLLELMSLRGYTKSDVSVFSDKAAKNVTTSFGEEDISVLPLEDIFKTKISAAIITENQNIIPKLSNENIKIINAVCTTDTDTAVPMIVGGINDNLLSSVSKNTISVPHPFVTSLLCALAEINKKYRIKKLRLSAYVAADFEEQDGMSELYNQTRKILMNNTSTSTDLFHKTLAFNVIPQVGSFIGEETIIEWLYNSQVKQVIGSETKVHANCAIVPVFVGIGMFVNVETDKEIDADLAVQDIKKTRGVLVLDKKQDGGYVSMTDAQGESAVFVSRIRQDITVENGISLWITGDSHKIAAQNILALLKQFLKKDKQ